MNIWHEIKWRLRIGWHRQKEPNPFADMTWFIWWHPATDETRKVWRHIKRIEIEPEG